MQRNENDEKHLINTVYCKPARPCDEQVGHHEEVQSSDESSSIDWAEELRKMKE